MGRSQATISSCPEIIPERMKSDYFNKRSDFVGTGALQPCEQSKQLSVSSKQSLISVTSWQITGYMSTRFLLFLSFLSQETPQLC